MLKDTSAGHVRLKLVSCGWAVVSKLITFALTQINKQSSSWASLGNMQRDSKVDYDPDLALFLTRIHTVRLQNSAGQNRKLADIIMLLILQLWNVRAGIHFFFFLEGKVGGGKQQCLLKFIGCARQTFQ